MIEDINAIIAQLTEYMRELRSIESECFGRTGVKPYSDIFLSHQPRSGPVALCEPSYNLYIGRIVRRSRTSFRWTAIMSKVTGVSK